MINGHSTPETPAKRKRNAVPRPDCPYCHSSNVVLDGKHRDKQRYWGKACNRTFVPTTNTAMSETIDKVCDLLLTIREDDIHMSDDDVKNKALFTG